jgi:hypothetical protein
MSKEIFKKFYGFLKIHFVSPPYETLLSSFPRRNPRGYNIFALGEGVGWYYSKELQLAAKYGYKIKILSSIRFVLKALLKQCIKYLFRVRSQYAKKYPINLITKVMLV